MRHSRGPFWMELTVAPAAIVISSASLWIAVRAGQTQERLLAASVWPFLQFSTSDSYPAPGVEIDFNLQNAGVGPARVRWASLYYGGKAYASAEDAFRICCGATKRVNRTTSYLQERVLVADETVRFIRVPKQGNDARMWSRLDAERLKFYVRACYCSVLDECWLFDSRRAQPQPVRPCPPAEMPRFSG